jgi:hypothetical protein
MTTKGLLKVLGSTGAMIGGGAVIGCALKGVDTTSLKGISKACAGLGILGLSHAAGNAAANAIGNDIENVSSFIETFFNNGANDEDETDE